MFTLMGWLRPKYIMFKLKKYRGVTFFHTGEWCKISRGIDLSVQNWHEDFNELWAKHSKISKIWPKYIIFEFTKHREVTFDGTENWCKIWRKTDMSFQKWHEEFGNFSPELPKLGLWWDPLIQSRKCMSLTFTGELCVNEEWCQIWRGIDLSVQNWHEEFDEFWPEHSKISKICILMGYFWAKYIMFELKEYRGVNFDRIKDWCKIWRKIDLYFQRWHKKFGKFLQAEK